MIYAVIDTNVLVSALITHNPNAATAKVTGNLKHYPMSPRVITPAQFLEVF